MLAAVNPQEVWTVEKGKLQLVFCCSAKREPGNWAECNKTNSHYFWVLGLLAPIWWSPLLLAFLCPMDHSVHL